jgi:hypothetical protein
MQLRTVLAAGAAVLVLGAAGCGSSSSGGSKPVSPNSAELSPPGDIPDNQAYVAYSPPGSGYSVKVPEGWARTSAGGAVTFTDKLNSVRMEAQTAKAPLTLATAKQSGPGTASEVKRPAGSAIRFVYTAAGKPDAVTGKQRTNDVERYVFFHKGKNVVLTLTGPKGADNVDPWKIITDSVRFTR